MKFFNKKCVTSFTLCCLLGLSFPAVVYGSSAVSYSSSAAAAAKFTDEASSSRLQPQDMFWVPFLHDKIDEEIKAIKRKAIGAALKKTDDSIPMLEEAIRYGHLPSMVALGEIYEQQGQMQIAYTWYILAFEEHWLLTGKHLLSVKGKLEDRKFTDNLLAALGKSAKKEKEKFFKGLSKPTGFFAYFPVDSNNSDNILQRLSNRAFDNSPYLTQIDDKDRNLRLMVRLYEVAGDGETASDPWLAVAQPFFDSKNHAKALKFSIRSGTPMALHNIGHLYEEGYLSIDNTPNYQEAVRYYLLSKSSRSFNNLGNLYVQGKLSKDGLPNYPEAAKYYELSEDSDALCNAGILYAGDKLGAPNYKKAEEFCIRSKTSLALFNLGDLHLQGKLSADGKPNYHEAVKCYELSEDPDSLCNAGLLYAGDKLGSPKYKKAEELYIRSKTPLAFFNLGYLYHIGKLSLSGEPDYHKAVEYYSKSGISDALHNAGIIHMNIFSNFKESAACFIKSATIDAQINLLLLYKDHSTKLGVDIDAHALTNKVHDQILARSVTEKLYFLGRLSFLNEQYEEAILSFSQALSKGYSNADCWLKNAQKALEIKQMEEKLAAQHKVDTSTDSNTAAPAQDQSDAKQEADKESDDDTDDELDSDFASSSSSTGAASTSVKAYKRSLNSSEKIARKKVKLQREIAKAFSHKMQFKSAQRIIDSPDTAEVVRPLTTAFVNDSVKTEYEARLPSDAKLARLMEDIWNKPWATEGEGKPEVLIGKFMGHKGCLSRRLDGEDRLVYKVTGPREILILACSGHYEC